MGKKEDGFLREFLAQMHILFYMTLVFHYEIAIK